MKKSIAIRAPEYFPRAAFFAQIDAVDVFVLADTLQYVRQSAQNRCKLRSPDGWHWISVPIRGRQHGTPIMDVIIDKREQWQRQHWKSLEFNYRSSPYFEAFEPEVSSIFGRPFECLGALSMATIETCCGLLGIKTCVEVASQTIGADTTFEDVIAACDATVLVVPPESAPRDAGSLPLTYVIDYDERAYRQNFGGFEPSMTVLDLLFNYGPDAISLIRQRRVMSRWSSLPD